MKEFTKKIALMLVALLIFSGVTPVAAANLADIQGIWRGTVGANRDFTLDVTGSAARLSQFSLPTSPNLNLPNIMLFDVTTDSALSTPFSLQLNHTYAGTGSNYRARLAGTVLHLYQMNQNNAVTATFSAVRQSAISPVVGMRTITASAVQPERGTVTASASGSLPLGTAVTLVAAPTTGWTFSGWYEGNIFRSSTPTWSFHVDYNRTTFRASFAAILPGNGNGNGDGDNGDDNGNGNGNGDNNDNGNGNNQPPPPIPTPPPTPPPTPTFTLTLRSNTHGGTVSINSGTFGGVRTAYFPAGAQVTVTARDAAGIFFDRWRPGSVEVAHRHRLTTTLTMPNHDVTLWADFIDRRTQPPGTTDPAADGTLPPLDAPSPPPVAIAPAPAQRPGAAVPPAGTFEFPAGQQPIGQADAAPLSININGRAASFDRQAVAAEGSVLIPVGELFRALGYRVDWDGGTRSATMRRGNITMVVTEGSSTFTVNGMNRNLRTPAVMMNDRLMVPFVEIIESIGGRTHRDHNNTIHIYLIRR